MLADRVCSSSAAGPRLTASRPFVPITRNVHSLRPSSRSLQTPITISAASALVPPVVSEPSSSQPVQPSALQQQVLATPAVQLAFNVIRAVTLVVEQARTAFAAALPKPDQIHVQVMQQQLRGNALRLAALALPMAKAFAAESLTTVYARTFERAAFGFAKMYLFALFMRVLLSWFPSIDWNTQPWTFLRLITEPYLQIYRGILPPLFGQLDFTPLVGFLILQDVVELMSPTYTMGMHVRDTSMFWTTSDVMCYFDGH